MKKDEHYISLSSEFLAKSAYRGLGVYVLKRKVAPTRIMIVQAYDAKQARKIASKNALARYKDDYLDTSKATCLKQRRIPGFIFRG